MVAVAEGTGDPEHPVAHVEPLLTQIALLEKPFLLPECEPKIQVLKELHLTEPGRSARLVVADSAHFYVHVCS